MDDGIDRSTKYSLMCEIKCQSTVGSLAIGYDDLYSAEQQSGYAKIYVPCYEQDKVRCLSIYLSLSICSFATSPTFKFFVAIILIGARVFHGFWGG